MIFNSKLSCALYPAGLFRGSQRDDPGHRKSPAKTEWLTPLHPRPFCRERANQGGLSLPACKFVLRRATPPIVRTSSRFVFACSNRFLPVTRHSQSDRPTSSRQIPGRTQSRTADRWRFVKQQKLEPRKSRKARTSETPRSHQPWSFSCFSWFNNPTAPWSEAIWKRRPVSSSSRSSRRS